MTISRLLIALALVLGVFICTFVLYVGHVRSSAAALVSSAIRITSSEDAEREIALWRKTPKQYSESHSPDGEDRARLVQIGNGLISRFKLAPSADLTVEVITRSGVLKGVIVGEYTSESSVWVQEDFSRRESNEPLLSVNRDTSHDPQKLVVNFAAGVPETVRKLAFALNTDCLAKFGGCKGAEQILPTSRDLEVLAKSQSWRELGR